MVLFKAVDAAGRCFPRQQRVPLRAPELEEIGSRVKAAAAEIRTRVERQIGPVPGREEVALREDNLLAVVDKSLAAVAYHTA